MGQKKSVLSLMRYAALHHFDALLVRPHDLLAPLVQWLQCLLSSVFLFHFLEMGCCQKFKTSMGRIYRGPQLM